MKILAMNGSPNRTGATFHMLTLLKEECEALGVPCDVVHMEDYSVCACQDCSSCTTRLCCSFEDDFMHLKARMLEADGIIIGSPYHYGRPVDTIEAFASRFSQSAFVKKEFKGKFFVGVATSAVDNAIQTARFCANLGDNIAKGGGQVSHVIWESIMLEEGMKDVTSDPDIRKNAKKVAKKLVEDIAEKKFSLYTQCMNYLFPSWFNALILTFKKRQHLFRKHVTEFLHEKGRFKNSRRMV